MSPVQKATCLHFFNPKSWIFLVEISDMPHLHLLTIFIRQSNQPCEPWAWPPWRLWERVWWAVCRPGGPCWRYRCDSSTGSWRERRCRTPPPPPWTRGGCRWCGKCRAGCGELRNVGNTDAAIADLYVKFFKSNYHIISKSYSYKLLYQNILSKLHVVGLKKMLHSVLYSMQG